ncbi:MULTISPECIES: 4Fe-4S dicluster domain-containing protein [unclassified Adlercreutzia]|uniref:4Fe-4S dicluster domain-containing protein n=1 Tax=unclassified Adlercreutzia TaxID=2636013 RepID=UPI0013ED71C4|nr:MULTISPECIES: 4Fe-4S dicluster domain-containing protein [unclassified Adlercreutzia]
MGSKFVIADPGLCIGCQTCLAGCLLKHSVPGDVAVPRLNLVTTLTISAPIVCHHCADAPCVASCPQNALYFDGDRVAIAQERCIGCRSCVMACPYGACDVVSENRVTKIGNLSVGDPGRAMLVKCDLCYDRPGGPACVAACPTGGLQVVDEEELQERSRKKRLAAAAASAAISSVQLNTALA